MEEQKLKEDKRGKLFLFASVTLVVLTIGFIYFEIYDPYNVPNFIRVGLALYWVYSAIAIYVSKFGSDEIVSKISLNVFRSTR